MGPMSMLGGFDPPAKDSPLFAKWLRTTYKSLGFTYATLHTASGVNLKQISNICTGKTRKPHELTWQRLVKALKEKHDSVRADSLSEQAREEFQDAATVLKSAPPQQTEVQALVLQRRGQEIFRRDLLKLWGGRCAISGLAVPELLRASHIKPWAVCEDIERLDMNNGLLLSGNLDLAFDGGLITVGTSGEVMISEVLDATAKGLLGLDQFTQVQHLRAEHEKYLGWHRQNVFRRGQPST